MLNRSKNFHKVSCLLHWIVRRVFQVRKALFSTVLCVCILLVSALQGFAFLFRICACSYQASFSPWCHWHPECHDIGQSNYTTCFWERYTSWWYSQRILRHDMHHSIWWWFFCVLCSWHFKHSFFNCRYIISGKYEVCKEWGKGDGTEDYSFIVRLWFVAKEFLQFMCYRKNVFLPTADLSTPTDEDKTRTFATFNMLGETGEEEPETLQKGRYISERIIVVIVTYAKHMIFRQIITPYFVYCRFNLV